MRKKGIPTVDHCIRCGCEHHSSKQLMCRECKNTTRREAYQKSKQEKIQPRECQQCKYKPAYFLISKPIKDIKADEIKAVPCLCMNCLLGFNELK